MALKKVRDMKPFHEVAEKILNAPCPDCKGRGRKRSGARCKTCNGSGKRGATPVKPIKPIE